VQRDEPGAFAELVEHYWTRIFGRFFRSFSDRQEAEDLAQEVFLRLYRSRKRLPAAGPFRQPGVFHITQNVARNALRSRKRHPSVRLSQPDLYRGRRGGTSGPRGPVGNRRRGRWKRAELAGVVQAAVV